MDVNRGTCFPAMDYCLLLLFMVHLWTLKELKVSPSRKAKATWKYLTKAIYTDMFDKTFCDRTLIPPKFP
jgi:hypothetical protein